MKWRLLHSTRFCYSEPVLLGPHEIRLRPAGSVAGELENYRLKIWPQPSVCHWRQDLWNNPVFQAWFSKPVKQLTILNSFYYQPRAANPFHFTVAKEYLSHPVQHDPGLLESLRPYLELPEKVDWIDPWRDSGQDSVSLLLTLNRWVSQRITYEVRPEPGVQSLATTLERGRGSCRDTAWMLALGLRALGYPSRFVSGYWLQVENTSAELHAWCEVYLAGAGWLGLDPVAGLVASNQHLAVARAPRPEFAAPVIGSHDYRKGEGTTEFRITVRRC
ncbi:transglutaminase family protein [bacterium]|nr:transglutaminase family protein [bacterium]